jgi:hypothetical protein
MVECPVRDQPPPDPFKPIMLLRLRWISARFVPPSADIGNSGMSRIGPGDPRRCSIPADV